MSFLRGANSDSSEAPLTLRLLPVFGENAVRLGKCSERDTQANHPSRGNASPLYPRAETLIKGKSLRDPYTGAIRRWMPGSPSFVANGAATR